MRDEGVETVSLYRNGPFTDLCRGPARADHQADQGVQAHQRGRAPTGAATPTRQMLTRVYGTAFLSKEDLDRAPRAPRAGARSATTASSGRELDLFMFSELSPGSPFWKPAGMQIWNELTELWRTRERRAAATARCSTPILYDVDLWKRSGHWDVYREQHVLHRRRGAGRWASSP